MLPYDIKLHVYTYLQFEDLLKVTNKVHHIYDSDKHNYNWAIRNKYLHVLIWFKINKRPITNHCLNSTILYNIKCKKIINFVKNIDWDKNIKYTQIFESLLSINDIDTVKYLMDKSITSPKYTDIYNPDTLIWLKQNCIEWYPKKNKSNGISLSISLSSGNNITVPGDLIVSGDMVIYGNCYVSGIVCQEMKYTF